MCILVCVCICAYDTCTMYFYACACNMSLPQEHVRNVLIKDNMRDTCVPDLVESWYQIMVSTRVMLQLCHLCVVIS